MPQPFHFAEALRLLLSQPVSGEQAAAFADYQLPDEQKTNGMLLLIRLLDSAKEGNFSAFREIRSLLENSETKGEEVLLIDDIPPE